MAAPRAAKIDMSDIDDRLSETAALLRANSQPDAVAHCVSPVGVTPLNFAISQLRNG